MGCVIAAGATAALMPWAKAEGIYTCVDAKGRRLTSDRPNIECLDREQTELSPGGQVVRKIGPSMTAEERAAAEEKARLAIEERNRKLEEKKRDRVLLARYPDKAAHDKERRAALASVDEVIKAAKQRVTELHADRKRIDSELEFYATDPKKVPGLLRRRVEENDQLVAAQMRFIANQEDEKKRVNARYDQELVRLKALWTPAAAASTAAAR